MGADLAVPHAVSELTALQPGQPIVFGGNRITTVPAALADAFAPGDRLIVVQETGDLLHVPAAQHAAAASAVDDAVAAFAALAACSDDQITVFFEAFARRLADDAVVAPIRAANEADVAAAAAAGRSTTRLALSDRMRADMVAGLRTWRDAPPARDEEIERIDHRGWSVAARRAPLGVVAFVFEGRPNVFADAAGVVRTGNAVVMRIGSDALGTAEAIVGAALAPALAEAGLPAGTVSLVRSPARSAGWALFDDRRLALAVARGSGAAVAQLGAVARQAGTPVSLHGTGGAWLVAGQAADADRFAAAVRHSLDRKVCNTLNVCCIPSGRRDLVPVFLDALDAAARARSTSARLHVAAGSRDAVPAERFATTVQIERADGVHAEPAASELALEDLDHVWEWERSPEVSLVVTADIDAAVDLCNRHSPRFVASLVSDDAAEHDRFYQRVDAPFVGDGFTRWVDGQYALDTPELGLSNWQGGRLLGRGGVLSGRSVHTVRYRATVTDPGLHR
ncbi:MAG TPA: aldehyde dehydrogenase family protein [Ilumatobacteraceae bacterium]|nr:aldehyde dehydrogenase family protein [Ilumatobacteraceae bacterium]